MSLLTYRPASSRPDSSGLVHDLVRAVTRRHDTTGERNRMPKRTTDFTNEADFVAYVQANPDAPITCACGGNGCDTCGGDGHIPAWTQDPNITGHPHERANS